MQPSHCKRLHKAARRTWATAVVLLAVFASPQARADDPVRAVELETENVRSSVRLIGSDLQAAAARERRYPLDRRFVEAILAYERGNLNTAAVQLMDLAYDPGFQRGTDYYESLYMLGDSLYRLRNYGAAKRYLDLVVKSRQGKHFQVALSELVDIAIRLHKYADVDTYASLLGNIPPSDRRTELMYEFGRSFFVSKQFDKASKYLSEVPVGTPHWGHARFYLGALHVQAGRIEDAQREFRDVVSAATTRDESRRPPQAVVDFCHLALGRLFLRDKKYQDSIYHYQNVDRNAPVYEQALFEMAAAHLAAAKAAGDADDIDTSRKRYKKALEALDILVLTVSDDAVAVEAAVLRGRINLMMSEYDAADAAYKDVVDRFSAITGELSRFVTSDKNLEQFFAWLLTRNSADYSVVRPVSERVARYLERDEDMGRVVALFDEMAAEKRDVKESAKLAETIDAALKRSTRLDIFPSLKDSWMKIVENENRVVSLGGRVVELLRGYAAASLSADERVRADALRKRRRALETAFAQIPATARDYRQRESRVDQMFNQIAAEVSILKAGLQSLRDQILAIEKMLNERVYGSRGLVLGKDREAEIRKALQYEKDELRRTFRIVDSLAQDVEIEANAIGAGDKVSADEGRVRGALLAAQRAEQAIYANALQRANQKTDAVSKLSRVRGDLDTLLVEMNGLFSEISKSASSRLGEIAKVLEGEKTKIAEYQIAVSKYEDESRRLAASVGYALIRNAERRLADIVLDADLGLVDVAWQRKQDKATAIRELQNERATKIQSLQGVLESLSSKPDDEEAEL